MKRERAKLVQGRNSSLFQGGCSWVKIFELGNLFRAEGAKKILGLVNLGKSWVKLGKLGKSWVKLGKSWVKLGRSWVKLGKVG